MVFDDSLILAKLQDVAKRKYDGHLTILRFTTNWRVGFITPTSRDDVNRLASGTTFAEAAVLALEKEGVRYQS